MTQIYFHTLSVYRLTIFYWVSLCDCLDLLPLQTFLCSTSEAEREWCWPPWPGSEVRTISCPSLTWWPAAWSSCQPSSSRWSGGSLERMGRTWRNDGGGEELLWVGTNDSWKAPTVLLIRRQKWMTNDNSTDASKRSSMVLKRKEKIVNLGQF